MLLRFIFKMDAVIRQAVQDKLRHKSQTQSDTYSQNVEDSTTTSSNQHTECTDYPDYSIVLEQNPSTVDSF